MGLEWHDNGPEPDLWWAIGGPVRGAVEFTIMACRQGFALSATVERVGPRGRTLEISLGTYRKIGRTKRVAEENAAGVLRRAADAIERASGTRLDGEREREGEGGRP